MNLDRRDATRLLTILVATATSPDGLSRTTQALTSGRVDTGVIDEIDEIDTMLAACQRQEDNLGPSAVLPAMLAQRGMIEDLLRGCSDATRPRLLGLYGRANLSLAYYVYDLGDSAGAARHCEDARRAGHEARDIALVVYTLCNIARFAVEDSRHNVAVDAAAVARRLVGGCEDRQLRAYVGGITATSHALTGNERQCMAAFDNARHALNSGTGHDDSLAYWFTEGALRSKESVAELQFGRVEQAAASAIAGLDLLDDSAIAGRACCLTRLADARVLGGEVAEATRLVADAADLATRYRSPRLVTALHTSRNRMAPWKDTPAVRELDQRLADLGLIIPDHR
ncbi:MAG: hypothetical protein ACR2GH_20810 [Pseudonocardia sp.]